MIVLLVGTKQLKYNKGCVSILILANIYGWKYDTFTKVSFAHNPKCSARIQKSGVRIQNRNVSYEVFLFFVIVLEMLVTKNRL